MADFVEVDFLPIGEKSSGDAILVRYRLNGVTTIHSIDGGYSDDGDKVISHIKKYYSGKNEIDHLVVTHPDRDHASGVKKILEGFTVNNLWMNRPWVYSSELIERFSRFYNVENLENRLREIYPFLSAVEETAINHGIPIREAFQGTKIGEFTVLSPSKSHFLDMVVESDKSPQSAKLEGEGKSTVAKAGEMVAEALRKLKAAVWGAEVFSSEETAAENEMSIVQFADLCGSKILLTGDAGRVALREAVEFAPSIGVVLPGVDKFQVPHHGSRRNVDTELLDAILGERLSSKPDGDGGRFIALISAAKDDPDHPRKAVIRAMWHRGGRVVSTNGKGICSYAGSAPDREGWGPVELMPYPDEQEE